MDSHLLAKRLMETFLVEYDERLHAMSRELLALESTAAGSPEREQRLRELARNAHSLKGAARAVDVPLIEVACQRFEDVLVLARQNPALFEQPLFDLFYGVLDGLAEAGQLLARGEGVEGTFLSGVSLELEALIAASPGVIAETPHPPARDDAEPEPASSRSAARAESASESPTLVAQETLSVRIDTEKLDGLLSSSAELLGARLRLRATASRLARFAEAIRALQGECSFGAATLSAHGSGLMAQAAPSLSERLYALTDQMPQRLQALRVGLDELRQTFANDWRLLDRAGAALDEQVRRIRMLPFSYCCVGLERMVRDLSRSSGKEVELVVEGGDVAIDRSVLDGLREPLRHLIRNAVDHGIEKPAERKRLGKPTRGRILASATLRGGRAEILVSDDGQGLDVEAIRRRAQEMKLPPPDDEQALIETLFTPGFSTLGDAADAVSERGVGLDVVRTQIKHLHGEVGVSSQWGVGTRFQLAVPLTLALLRVLLIRLGQHVFAIGNYYVHKLLRVAQRDILWVGGQSMLHLDGQTILLRSLAKELGLPQPAPRDWPGKLPAVVLKIEHRLVAFLVDELLAEQEVSVTNLGTRVQRLRNLAGTVILPDGRVALTLQVADLLRQHEPRPRAAAARPQPSRPAPSAEKKRRRILVVDDSMTTRSLERELLESVGFLVDLASDGMQGWDRIQAGGIDLVLSDIEMPLMNGYQLTQLVRHSGPHRSLPVILVTSKDDTRSQERGLAAGANAYLVKGKFDQDTLLGMIDKLL